MKIFFVFVCVIALTVAAPRPDDDEEAPPEDPPGGDGEGADPPEDADPPPDGGEENLGDGDEAGGENKDENPEGGDDKPDEEEKKENDINDLDGLHKDEKAAEDADKCVTGKDTAASLLIPAEEEPPSHVVTNVYGEPLKTHELIEHDIGGNKIQIYTEKWLTEHTFPPTKPNCLCQTRGPLTKFKLIGNIHFRHIKVPPRHPSQTTSNGLETICPPCNCADCFTTQTVTKRRDKVC